MLRARTARLSTARTRAGHCSGIVTGGSAYPRHIDFARFRAIAEGKPDMRLTFLDDLRRMEAVPQYIKDRLGDIKKTNFDRLIGDPDIRNLLGLEIVDNKLQLINGINPFLLMVLNDLVYWIFRCNLTSKSDSN